MSHGERRLAGTQNADGGAGRVARHKLAVVGIVNEKRLAVRRKIEGVTGAAGIVSRDGREFDAADDVSCLIDEASNGATRDHWLFIEELHTQWEWCFGLWGCGGWTGQ